MATSHKNNRSSYKAIRFPHEMLEQIEKSIEAHKKENLSLNFSAWVIDACAQKIEQQKK